MFIPKYRGGMIARKERIGEKSVIFLRKPIASCLMNRDYRSFRIKEFKPPYKIVIEFSKDKKGIRFRISNKKRVILPIPNEFSSALREISYGRVTWNNSSYSQIIINFHPSFVKPRSETALLEIIQKNPPIIGARMYKSRGSGKKMVSFIGELGRVIVERKYRGAMLNVVDCFIELLPQSECIIPCNQCSNVFCHPFSFKSKKTPVLYIGHIKNLLSNCKTEGVVKAYLFSGGFILDLRKKALV